ncbi:hypothetical protein EYF80_023590 [Liparis tanakae]|uniref:Uncharacterized protein n=1 Tax=Liparis tanakae TaxID=230148 RepID=A0A4Z2HMU6_9TELE|nr:hypothetical protein EYF80_023590 [Liparis tanakae]
MNLWHFCIKLLRGSVGGTRFQAEFREQPFSAEPSSRVCSSTSSQPFILPPPHRPTCPSIITHHRVLWVWVAVWTASLFALLDR